MIETSEQKKLQLFRKMDKQKIKFDIKKLN